MGTDSVNFYIPFLTVVLWGAWAVVFYSYCLFPLLLALLARFRASAGTASAAQASAAQASASLEAGERKAVLPRVAMVVAAYNEAHNLPAKLANTWQIDYPADRFHLLIGSDGSSDNSADLLRDCSDERLCSHLFETRRGKISVLNDLVASTDADILVMSDANTLFAPDAIKALVARFADPRVGCVSGQLRLEQEGGVSGEGIYWRYEGWIKQNESRLGFLIGCNGGIFALRRLLYTPLPASTIVEDFVLTLRVLEQGHQVVFEPAARATEPACESTRLEMRRKIRIGAGGWQALGLTAKMLHPRHGLCAFAFFGHKVLRWAAPLLLLAAFAANLSLIAIPGARTALFYDLLLLFQLSGLLVAFAAYWAKPGWPLPKWTRPVSYFYLMNYSLLCGFLRFLFKTQRVTWDKGTSAPVWPPASPLPAHKAPASKGLARQPEAVAWQPAGNAALAPAKSFERASVDSGDTGLPGEKRYRAEEFRHG